MWHGASAHASGTGARPAGSGASTTSPGAGSATSATAAGCSRDASARRSRGSCHGTAGFQPGTADRENCGNARSSRGDDGGT